MIEHEESTGNVFADLGLPDADEMLIKSRLVAKIAEIIEARGWTQTQTAEIIGLPQPKLSKMLNGQFRGISQAKLLECLARLGRDVQIVIGPDRFPVETGHVAVVFA
ncbi:MAG: helix-turn-helix domain-containing protein [Azoarcus sp.]|jgi:predicted XRE-type DNA-binding protein|nr:helix-turn-helix domain-containing protein [Azoarcus sp.]